MELTGSGKALVVTLFFYSLFGGYMMGLMQYFANEAIEALSIFLLISILLGISAALFVYGKRYGFIGVMALSIIIIILESPTVIHEATTGQTTTGVPIALDAWWYTLVLLFYLFPLIAIILSVRAYRET